MEVVLASGNRGKLGELSAMLAGCALQLRAQSDFGIAGAAETGATFVENAILKARHAAAGSGRAALADDSGLCVDALDGAPGVHSARYAGAAASDADNIARLLAELRGVARRRCRFVCVMVFMRHAHDPLPLIASGEWAGHVLEAPRGSAGFGYDPVFGVADRDCSAAELAPEEKNRISHRGRATMALLAALRQELAAP